MYDTEKMVIEGKTFGVLASFEDSMCFNWSSCALLVDDEGNLFYLSESGCSCNSFGDDTALADLTPVTTRVQAVELMRELKYTESEVYEFAARVAAL